MKAFLMVTMLAAIACGNEQNGNALAGGGSPDSGNAGGGNGAADARPGSQLDGGSDARVGTGGGGDAGSAPDARSTADAGGGVISVDAASLDGGGGGGAPGDIPAFTFRSGTRIRVRTTTTTITTADGASYSTTQFNGWFDRERNEECAPSFASDEARRCLPTNIVEAEAFRDSRCTAAIAKVLGAATPLPAYLKTAVFTAQQLTWRIFPRDEAVPKEAMLYQLVQVDTRIVCGERSQRAGEVWYASGTEIAPTQFAAMTIITTTTE